MRNSDLVLLCGTSFSGKSTVARAIGEHFGATVISLDEINLRRGLHSGQGVDLTEWQRTHDMARAEVKTVIEGGQVAVVDDTSSPRFLRDRWRELAGALSCVLRLVYLETDRETVMRRRQANNADPTRPDVSDGVLFDHLDHFEPPEADEQALVIRPDDEIESWLRTFLESPRTTPNCS